MSYIPQIAAPISCKHRASTSITGVSSYINGLICRYKDANTAWTSASDGTREEIRHYAQNWRGDVVGLVDDAGKMIEWAKYAAYGVPFGLPKGDADSDGDCDATDANTVIQGWIDASAYDARGDLDLDGDVDSGDKSTALASPQTLGRTVLSSAGNFIGWNGYRELASASTDGLYHAQARMVATRLGRWTVRDEGYLDAANLYEYACGGIIVLADPTGRWSETPVSMLTVRWDPATAASSSQDISTGAAALLGSGTNALAEMRRDGTHTGCECKASWSDTRLRKAEDQKKLPPGPATLKRFPESHYGEVKTAEDGECPGTKPDGTPCEPKPCKFEVEIKLKSEGGLLDYNWETTVQSIDNNLHEWGEEKRFKSGTHTGDWNQKKKFRVACGTKVRFTIRAKTGHKVTEVILYCGDCDNRHVQ